MVKISKLEGLCCYFDYVSKVSLWHRVVVLRFSVDQPHCVVKVRRDHQWEFRKTKRTGDKLYVKIFFYKRGTKKINIKRVLKGKYSTGVADYKGASYSIQIEDNDSSMYSPTVIASSYTSEYELDETMFPPGHILNYLLNQKLEEINGK